MVKAGERVIITDHDKIVAEIIPSRGISNENERITKYINEQIINGSIIKAEKKKMIIENRKQKGKIDNNQKEIYEETRSDR